MRGIPDKISTSRISYWIRDCPAESTPMKTTLSTVVSASAEGKRSGTTAKIVDTSMMMRALRCQNTATSGLASTRQFAL